MHLGASRALTLHTTLCAPVTPKHPRYLKYLRPPGSTDVPPTPYTAPHRLKNKIRKVLIRSVWVMLQQAQANAICVTMDTIASD
jgi:hypothetical protein